ncbi:MAG: hypothetical protein ACJA13_003427, partial [Paraglaciecola sp.]
GEIEITAQIIDSNLGDSHIISWNIPTRYQGEISANQQKVFIDPSNLILQQGDRDIISLSVKISDSGLGELSVTEFIHLPILATQPRLTTSDTDRDGITDVVESFVDDDLDGLPAFMDTSDVPYIQPLHVNAAITRFIETEPGLHLSLGKYARQQLSDGMMLSEQEILATGHIPADSINHQDEYFDFEIRQITPVGRSVSTVIPLQENLPEFAAYRKFTVAQGWQDFVEDANNTLASALAVNDVCPPPHSEIYQAGLTQGDNCLRLTIKDGGINDADGIENGSIDDPGGIAIIAKTEIAKGIDPVKSSSGGAFFVNLIFLLLILGWRGLYALSTTAGRGGNR